MDEFMFDKEAADRIGEVVRKYPLSLANCAEILEMTAPIAARFTVDGFKQRFRIVFREANREARDGM